MRRHQKLSAADRRKRAARNERRGRHPVGGVVAAHDGARFFRYGAYMVRVFRGRVEVMRIWNPVLQAYVPSPAPKSLAKLPRSLRRQIAEEAADADRRERMEGMGVEVPPRDVWTPASGATVA
jgi:hypothetical protein